MSKASLLFSLILILVVASLSFGQPPKGRELISGVIKNDFLVNDDTTGGCSQQHSAVAGGSGGSFVVCWEDYRNGEPDIYAQIFDSLGGTIGHSFLVNDDAGANEQFRPSVAMGPNGEFVICWFDHRIHEYWDPDLYAQRYSSSGQPIGSNFKVSSGEGTAYQDYPPSVSMDASGGFVICWTDYSSEYNDDIYAQRYDSSGQAVDGNFRVNDDEGRRREDAPSVAVNTRGDFVVCWEHKVDENRDIYARRYSSSGTPLGPSFKVNEGDSTYYQHPSPSIAMDTSGAFVVCWEDKRNGNADIYAQRYDLEGNGIGLNFRVNDDVGATDQWGPSVSIGLSGDFMICWQDRRNGNWDIFAQHYTPSGDTSGANFRVNDDQGSENQENPSVSVVGERWLICWTDNRNGRHNQDIYAQRLDNGGKIEGENFLVNDDMGTADELHPAIAVSDSGDFIVCWTDGRQGNWDVCAQRFGSKGQAIGINFRVNDDTGAEDQQYPSISMDGEGNFVICWQDQRNGNSDIYGQRYSSSGEPLGQNFMVNDNSDTSDQGTPAVSMHIDGGFGICWTDTRNRISADDWVTDIYFQAYSSNGEALGPNRVVNELVGMCVQADPSLYGCSNGNFVTCWIFWCYYMPDSRIVAQRFSSVGNPLGSNFLVSDNPPPYWRTCPSVSAEPLGGFTICWLEEHAGYYEFEPYAQRYSPNGDTIGSNFQVSDSVGTSWYSGETSISMSKTCNTVICWGDHRNGDRDIYAQRYLWDWRPWGSNYRVNNNPDVSNPNQNNPSVGTCIDHVVFVWEDARRGKGWDIYGKMVTWNWEKVDEEKDDRGELPRNFALLQNYPNPFNPITQIKYALHTGCHVKLTIYNILGQEVATLVDKSQAAGYKSVPWDSRSPSGNEVTSGIYFYQLQAGDFAQTRKMILMR